MKLFKSFLFFLLALGISSPFLVLGYFLIGNTYDISPLVNYSPDVTTKIYDKNGDKIANLFNEKHRYYTKFEEIPPRMIEALLAIEDTTFFEHPGINIDAILRAIIKVAKAGKAVEGASTITQQLVKNVLLTREKKISRKIQEAIYSIKLEKALSKEQILEYYFNEIYYGHGYYGIKTASNGYFHKNLKDLSLKEIAILVGLPKAPSVYAPTKNYEISMGRANRVISRMFSIGWIDDKTYSQAMEENPDVFDDTLTQNKAPFVVDEVLREIQKQGIKDIKTGGYEIFTTIDLRLQELARKSLNHAYELSLKRTTRNKKRAEARAKKRGTEVNYDDFNRSLLNGAFVSIDSSNGDILALVGSVDYKKNSYNRASQGRRQPGSAFKPFIYQVAVDLGFSGDTKLVDIAKTYRYTINGKNVKWQPKNYSKKYKGLISLRNALVYSSNLATINLVQDIGLGILKNKLNKFGISNVPNDLSASLGTMSLSPLQLAQYYTTFSNYGEQVKTQLIKKIDKNGEEVFLNLPEKTTVTSRQQSFILISILRDVINRGTGKLARVRGVEIAGKTGTTNKNIDGWFAGFSPEITSVVWFGNDDNTPMHRQETGGIIAAPAFAYFYKDMLKLYPQMKRKFTVPEGIIEVGKGKNKEYYSDVSKPPRQENTIDVDENLIF